MVVLQNIGLDMIVLIVESKLSLDGVERKIEHFFRMPTQVRTFEHYNTFCSACVLPLKH